MSLARPVPGFPGYYITATGALWTRKQTGRLRKMRPSTLGGYAKTMLWRDGKHVPVKIHVLVAAAFLGPRPDGMDVRHLDGNALNNVPSNLAYGTRKENIHDSLRLGKHQHGVRNGSAKLDPMAVRWMRVYHHILGFDCALLGKVFGVAGRVAWGAVHGRTWKRVEMPFPIGGGQ